VSHYSSVAACFDGLPHIVDQIDEPVDHREVFRYAGYPADRLPSESMQPIFDHWIAEAAERAEPRGVYVVLPVAEIGKRMLRLQTTAEVCEFSGAIAEFLGPSRFVVAFIATAGPNVERLASELLQTGDDLGAIIVNAVGAERAEAAESQITKRVVEQIRPFGFAPSLPYSPGYCGMALTEQQQLFSLFGHQTAGVTLTDDCVMRPLKSVSGLIGLGPAEEIGEHGSPCDRCELYSCAMRR
jgi:hypothetical protein